MGPLPLHANEPLDPPPQFDTLALLFSHYPIIIQIAKLISTGDLIQLSRTSSTIRETLLQSPSYWAKLIGLTTLKCSESDHVKGENIKGCQICSLPVCETCIVRSDFFGRNGTFYNRIRTFCDTCWSATYFSRTNLSEEDDRNHAAPVLCVCVARDSWLCSTCRAIERSELLANGVICATDGCEAPHQSSEKHRVCTWCRHPLPPAWRPQGESAPGRRLFNEDGGEAFAPHPSIVEPVDDNQPASGEDAEGGELRRTKSTDKVAGWDKEDEDSKQRYELAWLDKGRRERERYMEQEPGESSSRQQLSNPEYLNNEADEEEPEETGEGGEGSSGGIESPPPYNDP